MYWRKALAKARGIDNRQDNCLRKLTLGLEHYISSVLALMLHAILVRRFEGRCELLRYLFKGTGGL
jgi:hypothetical protein